MPLSVLDFDGNAEHGQFRQRRRHAGQVGCAARAGDDDLVTSRLGALGERKQPVGGAVG